MNRNRSIRKAFSSASQSYDRSAVLQREVCNRLIERLSEVGKKARWILDIGAGTGTSTRRLQQMYPHADCIAVDFAYPMLRELRRQSVGPVQLPPVCADASSLPFAGALFDLVFSSLTLQWCEDPAMVFGEVRRVMAPKGLFLFTTLGPDTLYELRTSWAEVDDRSHVNRFIDMHDIGDALLRAGFSDPVVDVERIVLTHRDVDVLLRDLKALGANTVIGDRRRGLTGRRTLQAMRDVYRQFCTPEGDFPATFEVIYGLAWQPDDQHVMQFYPPDRILE